MALEGDLAIFRLPDILQVVAQQRKTGILTVQGASDILALNFSNGEIVAADALNQSFEDLLGGVLDARGVVPAERYAQLIETHRTSGERLVDFLVDSGAASRDEVLDALRELTYRLLLEVLGWREGQFKFYGGEEVAYEEGIRPLKVDEVLMRSLGDLPSPGRASVSPRAVLAYVRVRDERPIRPIPESFDERTPLDPNVVWVTPDERMVLERLDGRTPVEKLARDFGMGESRFLYAVYRLQQAGLVRPVDTGEEPPAPAVVRGPAPPRPAKVEALSYDRPTKGAPAAPEVVEEPFLLWLEGAARWGVVVAGLILAVVGWLRPGVVLVPAGDPEVRETYGRLLDLSRYEMIDRGARTFHLLEGRYPSSLDDLVARGLTPARARRDPEGRTLTMRSEADQYRLDVVSLVAEEGEVRREGVFGDFLLDRELFAGLDVDPGIPLVLLD